MSPEQSDIRKSLDSIQSLLSQGRSPMTATSLADRIHRASLEGGLEQQQGGGGTAGGLSPRLSNGSRGRGYEQTTSEPSDRASADSGVEFTFKGAPSLEPIAEPNGAVSGGSSSLSPPGDNRDSLSYTPFQQIEAGVGLGLTATGVNLAMTSTAQRTFQMDGRSATGVIRSPSSAFSAVKKLSPGAFSAAASSLGGPPFGGSSDAFTAQQTSATPANSIMSGALGSVSSASRTGGRTMASGHMEGNFGGVDAPMMGSAGNSSHQHGPRRETSLLVSPVSAVHHARSPQSEMSAAASVFGSQASPPGTMLGMDATPSAASARSGTSSTVQRVGPTGTPMVASSVAAASGKGSVTPATAGLTIHTNLQKQPTSNGRDPTPYHYRSNPSASPYEDRGKENNENGKKHSDASSRSGRDPPAKSPFPSSINTSISAGGGGNSTPNHHSSSSSGYTTGFATNKSTPNVHSHHYHKEHHLHGHHGHGQLEDGELSMIEEDESVDTESLVSHVTGSTFVRSPRSAFVRSPTPFAKKQHNSGHTPKNNMAGNHTPRSMGGAQHYATPGSTASTAIHATPSTSQLLHRPSLAMRENLAHLATATSRSLEEIWDQVGVAPDDRASQLADLVERIGELCEEKVRDEERVRDQFRKEIELARREWEDTCRALALEGEEDPVSKMRRDPSSKELGGGSNGVNLQLEYEALTGRLESLRSVREAAANDMQASRTKIYEAFAALNGCTVEEASQASELRPYADIESNLTSERREEFRGEASEYEERVAERTKAVVSLLLDCQGIIRDLDMVPPCCEEESVGRSEDDAKIMNSLESVGEDEEDNHLERDGHHHNRGHSNNYTVVSLLESPTCIGIGSSAMDRITSRIAELNGEKRRRRARLGEMGQAISSLWQMLRVPPEEQQAFTTGIRGLGLDTLRKGEAEIARLEELKSVMIGKLVREQRSTIEELWDKTNSSAAERAAFDAYFHIHDDDQLTSEVLMKHEEYVAALKAKLDKMQPILDLIAKREAIIEERVELEFLQKDPDRLKGRGATKQLMKEEKMTRRVTKELPKITSLLEKTLRQWHSENRPDDDERGHPDLGHFMYRGRPYLHTIQCQEEEWRTRKERGEQERQRKREEERAAASSAQAAFGYATYKALPGKKQKWNASTTNANNAGARPRSASNARSGSNVRSGSNMRSGGSHPTATSGGNNGRSGSNMRFGGRGPLGDVSSSRQNASRPPSRPRGGGAGAGGDRGKKAPIQGRDYRPGSAPRMRF